MPVLARVRSFWWGLVHRAGMEAEMEAEFRHHLAMRTDALIRGGVAGGGGAARAGGVRPGLRMLVKYPWLSLVSVAGMAVAIAIGAGAFGAIEA